MYYIFVLHHNNNMHHELKSYLIYEQMNIKNVLLIY